MNQTLTLLVLAALFAGLVLFSRRNRQRAAEADAARRERLRPGSEVMTTSGLYATVVGVNQDDGTALLAIAPGVEVRWTIAALREVSELPEQYREGADPVAPEQESAAEPGDLPPGNSGQPNT